MERQALHELCRQVVQDLAHEQGWLLSANGLYSLVEAIFPFIQQTLDLTPQTIRTITLNYNVDGPLVQQMLAPHSTQGEQLWTEWRARFFKIAATKKLTNDDAEDLVQTVYVEAFRALPTFHFHARLNTYFFAIFNNQYKKWLQHHAKLPPVELDADSTNEIVLLEDTTHAQIESREVYHLVKQEIEKIVSSTDYQILYWYYVEEREIDANTREQKKWTDKAIGEKLGMPLDTVTARRRRALQRLRQNPRLAHWAALFNLTVESDS